MKSYPLVMVFILTALCQPASADGKEDPRALHKEGSEKLADEQDELSADVQQLVTEQTVPKVIELLGEVEDIMDEAVEKLAESDTGGDTIAAQTEIIEKIHAAAKERQQQGGSGKSGGAMMDMMERMMGKDPGEGKQGQGKDGKPSDSGGGGTGGASDAANDAAISGTGGASEVRKVPKAAGTAGTEIPSEFRKAFDAYNRGAEKKVK